MKDLHHGARELSVRSEQIASKRLCCKQPGSRTFDFNDDEAASGVLSNQEVSDSFAFTTQHRSADIGLLLDNDNWKLERKTENKWIGLKKVLSGSFFQIFSKHGLHAINQFVEGDLLDNRI